jgi:hypothetical protein
MGETVAPGKPSLLSVLREDCNLWWRGEMLGDFGGLRFLVSGFSSFSDDLLIAVAAASIISVLEIGVSLPCVLQSSEVRDSSIEHSSSAVCGSPL